MKNLKLLNKKYLSIIFLLLLGFASQSQEPIDIWNVEVKQKIEENQAAEIFEDKFCSSSILKLFSLCDCIS